MSGTEIAVILIVALLLLGPTKLPELARSLGKGLRDFRRATDDIRTSVETEFYRMDQPKPPPAPEVAPVATTPPVGALAAGEARPADAAAEPGASATATEAVAVAPTPDAAANGAAPAAPSPAPAPSSEGGGISR